MLLRRIAEHVRAQNWTAIAIDFVIVVTGVFIGIQVANLNESRIAERNSRLYENRLREEMVEIDRAIARRLALGARNIDGTRALIEYGEGKSVRRENLEQALGGYSWAGRP